MTRRSGWMTAFRCEGGAALGLLLSVGGLMVPVSDAHAEGSAAAGWIVDAFHPAAPGGVWFGADALRWDPTGRPAVTVVAGSASDLLVVRGFDGSVRASVIGRRTTSEVGLAFGIGDTARLSLQLPVVVDQSGSEARIQGGTLAAPTAQALGDLRVGVDLRLLGSSTQPSTRTWTLAAGLRARLPTGSTDAYASDGTAHVRPTLLAAGTRETWHWAADLARDVSGGSSATPAGTEQPVWLGHAGAAWQTRNGRWAVAPELWWQRTDAGSWSGEVLLGLRRFEQAGWQWGVGAAAGLGSTVGIPSSRLMVQLGWSPTNLPELPPLPPPPPRARPVDPVDPTPQVALQPPSRPEPRGELMPVLPEADPGDALLPMDDSAAVDFDLPPDLVGEASTPEPTVAAAVNAPAVASGSDSDGDGVPNEADGCPAEAGPANFESFKSGCPLGAVVNGQFVLPQTLRFRDNNNLLGDTEKYMPQVLAALQRLPSTQRLRIECHTDSTGDSARNQASSVKRAATVVRWLVAHGQQAERFEVVGMGDVRPIDTNDTKEGQKRNRRVEFHLIEATATPSQPPAGQ